jgi:Tn3 transposase DDE domain-containing protein
VKTEHEQQVWSECSKLIANATIFYNTFILSKLLASLTERQQDALAEMIKKVSPVAWRHVNLGGRFVFNSKKQAPNIDGIISALEEVLTNLFN